MFNVDDLKTALKIDGNDDDELLQSYLNAAELFVRNAVTDDDADSSFFDDKNIRTIMRVAVFALAGDYYTYRTAHSDVQNSTNNFTCNAIIGTLRGKYEVWKTEQAAKDGQQNA